MMFVSFILSRIVEENISSISAVELGNVKIVQQNRKPREQKGMTEYCAFASLLILLIDCLCHHS